jgi:hypothetical protein
MARVKAQVRAKVRAEVRAEMRTEVKKSNTRGANRGESRGETRGESKGENSGESSRVKRECISPPRIGRYIHNVPLFNVFRHHEREGKYRVTEGEEQGRLERQRGEAKNCISHSITQCYAMSHNAISAAEDM